jgi:hypothetical protein
VGQTHAVVRALGVPGTAVGFVCPYLSIDTVHVGPHATPWLALARLRLSKSHLRWWELERAHSLHPRDATREHQLSAHTPSGGGQQGQQKRTLHLQHTWTSDLLRHAKPRLRLSRSTVADAQTGPAYRAASGQHQSITP